MTDPTQPPDTLSDDPVSSSLVRADLERAMDAIEPAAWASFGAAVRSRIAAEVEAELAEALPASEAALEAVAAEVDGRAWSSFGAAVRSRISTEVEAELSAPSAEAAQVRADLEAETASRAGQWSAFAASVSDQIRAAERVAARTPIEVRAIETLREDVAAELESVEPRFEKTFRREVEAKRDAPAAPSFLDRAMGRMRGWLHQLSGPQRLTIGGLAAVAAASMMFVAEPTLDHASDVVNALPSGAVSVDDVSFEGMVTVIENDGQTVIWLADAS